MTRTLCATLLTWALVAPAQAATFFTAPMDGIQAATGSTATATATLVLNAAQTELSYDILIDGLDFGAMLTPLDPNDDISNFHIHVAPPGVSGPVVFGMFGPTHDVDDFSAINDGGMIRFTGVWDAADESTGADPLSTRLGDLFAGDLYLNAHTPPFPAGEIRGQILLVPEPASGGLLVAGLGALAAWRRARPSRPRGLS